MKRENETRTVAKKKKIATSWSVLSTLTKGSGIRSGKCMKHKKTFGKDTWNTKRKE